MNHTLFDREAMFYKVKENQVICTLCPHYCHLEAGDYGLCGVRQHIDHKLVTHNYGLISGLAIDPISKKPLLKFMEGSQILSIGSIGCNLHCRFCQNSDISKEFEQHSNYRQLTPKEIVDMTLDYHLKSIAYTYNEPTVFYEMVYDTAVIAHEAGLKNVLVTNGYINPRPLEYLLPYIDAMNIDVKTYDDDLYQDVCGGSLQPVLETIGLAVKNKIHVELTCLIVPKLFEDLDQVELLFKELKKIAGDLVIHISRYFPRYLYNEPRTNIDFMVKIQCIALKYFTVVKLGNVS